MTEPNLMQIYRRLYAHYGPQHWWPADSPFEVMVGAILTQNTNWRNVEAAITRLKEAGMLDAGRIAACNPRRLAELIRSSGFYNQKAERLQAFCRFYRQTGGENGLLRLPDPRHALLSLHGIGPETADSILLYALGLPVFVIDAYTKRIASRLGIADAAVSYPRLQEIFTAGLPEDADLYNEYHALLVAHAKRHCRTRPLCDNCPLADCCAWVGKIKSADRRQGRDIDLSDSCTTS